MKARVLSLFVALCITLLVSPASASTVAPPCRTKTRLHAAVVQLTKGRAEAAHASEVASRGSDDGREPSSPPVLPPPVFCSTEVAAASYAAAPIARLLLGVAESQSQ